MNDVTESWTNLVNNVALPTEPDGEDVAEVKGHDVKMTRRGKDQVIVVVPSREAEKDVRRMFATGEDESVSKTGGFMVNEENDDGSIELRIERSVLLNLTY